MTNAEIAGGKYALFEYVKTITWKAVLIPDQFYQDGTIDIIRAADASPDQSPNARITAAQNALGEAIRLGGHGNSVTVQEVHIAASIVLAIVAHLRNKPVAAKKAARRKS